MEWSRLVTQVVDTVLFGVIGIVLFAVAVKLIQKTVPFSLTKEIAEDQNVALGVVMGSVMLGLAIIVAAAVHG
jgi:putative membrane protein